MNSLMPLRKFLSQRYMQLLQILGGFLIPAQDKKPIADNIASQAAYATILFIWTDCDREGEHIGTEVRDQAKKGNSRIEVKRARFSNTERAYEVPFSKDKSQEC